MTVGPSALVLWILLKDTNKMPRSKMFRSLRDSDWMSADIDLPDSVLQQALVAVAEILIQTHCERIKDWKPSHQKAVRPGLEYADVFEAISASTHSSDIDQALRQHIREGRVHVCFQLYDSHNDLNGTILLFVDPSLAEWQKQKENTDARSE